MATGEEIAEAGFKYLGTPYSVMDCQAFVEKCLADCGIHKNLAGSNAWYRYLMKNGWIGTPEECRKVFGFIPVGAFLFIWKNDGKEPEKYKPDGIGNASHIGIYTGTGMGAINSSSTRGCVCESNFKGKSISGGWNRVGLWTAIDYGEKVNRILNGGGESVEVNYQAQVIGGGLNMRKSPTMSAEKLTQIPNGTLVTVTEEDGDWGKTSYKNLTGWVLRKYLEKIDPGEKTITVPRKELEKIYDALGDLLGLRG